jgi:uncharacterized membrane protein YebE (DUF533 family)
MEPHKPNISITDSRFAMWRAAVALAWVDGRMKHEEIELLNNSAQINAFTDEQKKIFENDLKTPLKLNDVFSQITDPRDRAHLINFARRLFHTDLDFSKSEEMVLKDLTDRHLQMLKSEKHIKKPEYQELKLGVPSIRKEQKSTYIPDDPDSIWSIFAGNPF